MLAARLWPLAAIAAVAALLWLIFPFGFPNYDTVYLLLWGQELAEGISPDNSAPLAPTPHPLGELWGILVSPLGDGSEATMVVAYLALGAIAYLVYRLGALWFEPRVGIVAAAIVLTRAPFLSNGLRAYVDLPYIALCLAALVIETRRPRAGWPVLALLGLSGLLRPEAWLFAAAYFGYLALAPTAPLGEIRPFRGRISPEAGRPRLSWRKGRRELIALGALAAAGPLLWAIFDWVTAGDPLYSFTGTRDTVETLERETGPVDLVLYGPRRLGEVLQWPGVIGAASGVVLCLAFLRRRAVIGVTAVAMALLAFAILATAGLAIIPRYTMLAAAILAVFCAAALLGWHLLDAGHPWRRRWQAFAALVAVAFVAWVPNQYDLLDSVYTDLGAQSAIEDDLRKLADSGAFRDGCLPISVPNHRAVPRLAIWLDLRASQVVSVSQQRQPERGYFLDPASEFVIRNFVLDPNDPARLETGVPTGFRLVERNHSWRLYARCG